MSNKKHINVRFTNFGIACCYGNTIELNPILFKYPKMFEDTLRHELEHVNNKSLFADLMTDFKSLSEGWTLEELKFSMNYLKIYFQQILPLGYNQGFFYNVFGIIMWSVTTILLILFWKFVNF